MLFIDCLFFIINSVSGEDTKGKVLKGIRQGMIG
jgi:hypothetical protein